MKKISLVITAVALGFLGFKLFKFGLGGLRTNLAGDSLISYSADSLYSDSQSKLYHYIKVPNAHLVNEDLIYNDEFHKTAKVISPILRESDIQQLNDGEKINVKLFAEFRVAQADSIVTITGIADKIDADEKEDIQTLNSNSLSVDEGGIIIRTDQSPRQWYWNFLMLLIPVVYMIAFTRAIINIFKGKPIGIPKNKI